MEVVRAGFGDELNIGAGTAARGGVAVLRHRAELLHRVERHAKYAGEGLARVLVYAVGAVEGDIGLVRLPAVYRAAAKVQVRDPKGAEAGHARLEGEQAGDIAGIHRHGFNR